MSRTYWRGQRIVHEGDTAGTILRIEADRIEIEETLTHQHYRSTVLASTVLDGERTLDDDLSHFAVGDRVLLRTRTLHPPALVAVGIVAIGGAS